MPQSQINKKRIWKRREKNDVLSLGVRTGLQAKNISKNMEEARKGDGFSNWVRAQVP